MLQSVSLFCLQFMTRHHSQMWTESSKAARQQGFVSSWGLCGWLLLWAVIHNDHLHGEAQIVALKFFNGQRRDGISENRQLFQSSLIHGCGFVFSRNVWVICYASHKVLRYTWCTLPWKVISNPVHSAWTISYVENSFVALNPWVIQVFGVSPHWVNSLQYLYKDNQGQDFKPWKILGMNHQITDLKLIIPIEKQHFYIRTRPSSDS